MWIWRLIVHRGPPRGFEEQGNKVIYFRGTREQKSKTEGNRGTKAILGNREHRKSRFWFWEQGKTPIFFQENKPGTGTPPPPTHTHPTVTTSFLYIYGSLKGRTKTSARIFTNENLLLHFTVFKWCSVFFSVDWAWTYSCGYLHYVFIEMTEIWNCFS